MQLRIATSVHAGGSTIRMQANACRLQREDYIVYVTPDAEAKITTAMYQSGGQ